MRVLDLTGHAADQFKGHEVHTREDGQPYDVIVTRHWLATRSMSMASQQLNYCWNHLVEGGEVHLLEPSAEWAAREVKAGRMDVPWYYHVYGSEETPHRAIFTLEQLRALATETGLQVKSAVTRPYTIAATADGTEYQADQHYVIAQKPGGGRAWIPD